jgi:hypothetical protein
MYATPNGLNRTQLLFLVANHQVAIDPLFLPGRWQDYAAGSEAESGLDGSDLDPDLDFYLLRLAGWRRWRRRKDGKRKVQRGWEPGKEEEEEEAEGQQQDRQIESK